MTCRPRPDLLAELRRRGVADVDDSTLTRALYSSDASLYRVVPQVVVAARGTPTSCSPILDVVAGDRRAGHHARRRHVDRRQRGRPGHRRRHRPAPQPGASRSTPRRAPPSSQPGVVHADLQRAAAPHGLRFGPDPSTHTRCTIGGMIGNNACGSRALGYGRTVDNVAALQVAFGTGEVADWPGATGGRRRARRRWPTWSTSTSAHVRTEFGRFTPPGQRLLPRAPAARERPPRRPVPGRLRGHARRWSLEATVRPRRATSRRGRLVVLGYPSMAEAADAVPALLAAGGGRLIACEGLDARIVDLVRARGSAVPELPARRRLAVRRGRRRRGRRARAPGSSPRPARSSTGSSPTPREAAALWRIREDGAGLAARSLPHARRTPAGRTPRCRPSASAPGCATSTSCCASTASTACPTATSATAACTCASTSRSSRGEAAAGAVFRDFLTACALKLREHGGSLSGEHGDGRARSELLPLMYDAESLRLFGAVKAICDPDNLLNPGNIVDPAPLDADLRAGAAAAADRAGAALRPRRRRARQRRAPLHRRRQVRRAADQRRDVPVLPRHPRREGLHPRPARGCCRRRSTATLVDGLADPAVDEALDLCLACKGCASDCPTGVDMATYKAEALHQKYAGRARCAARAATTLLGRLPTWAALAAPVAPRRQPDAAGCGPVAAAGQGHGRHRPAPLDPGVRDRRRCAAVARARPARRDGARPDVWIWADSFTDHFLPQSGHAAIRVPRGGRPDGAGDRRRRLLRADLGHHRPARPGPVDHGAHGRHARAVRRQPACRSSGSSRPAWPPCAATPSSSATTRGRRGRRGRADASPSCSTAPGLDRRPTSPASRSSPSRTATRPRCWAGPPTRRCSSGPARPSPGSRAAAGWPATSAWRRATTRSRSRSPRPTCCPPSAPTADAVVLADGMSCRVQLDDLAGVPAMHLAELLASRTRRVNPRHRRLVIPVALVALLLIVVIAAVVNR